MDWEVDVYKVTAKCKVGVSAMTKHEAEQNALKKVQMSAYRLMESGEGWIATANSYPYNQKIDMDTTYQKVRPRLWSPPSWMKGKAINIGSIDG